MLSFLQRVSKSNLSIFVVSSVIWFFFFAALKKSLITIDTIMMLFHVAMIVPAAAVLLFVAYAFAKLAYEAFRDRMTLKIELPDPAECGDSGGQSRATATTSSSSDHEPSSLVQFAPSTEASGPSSNQPRKRSPRARPSAADTSGPQDKRPAKKRKSSRKSEVQDS